MLIVVLAAAFNVLRPGVQNLRNTEELVVANQGPA